MVRSKALESHNETEGAESLDVRRDGVKTSAARSRLEPAALLSAYRVFVLSRELDQASLRLRRQGKAYFQIGCAGHELVGVAAALHLRPGEDWVYPYYRDQALVLGLGVEATDILRQVLAKRTDPASGGRSMPNHFGSTRLHIVPQSSPTGTQFPQAVGTAEAGRLARRAGLKGPEAGRQDELVYVSAGEGATSQGEFYEAINAAVLGELPVLFVVHDNEYAISVPVEEQTAGGSIAKILSGFEGLSIETVDGLDFGATWEAFERAVAVCRSGRGPALVHARVVRLVPHSDSDDEATYRTERERSAAALRDPLPAFERWLGESGISPAELDSVREEVAREVRRAVETVDPELEPDPATILDHLWNPVTLVKVEPPAATSGEPVTMVDAINRALAEEMERDPRVVVFGEDVADASRAEYLDDVRGKGGVFKVTAGLQRRFGSDRVFNTPLAEAGIIGRAIGMAVRGARPVAEIQFLDFIWPALNQIRSELALLRWRSNGAFQAPVVVRAPSGGYLRGGAIYHSQSGESVFCSIPGLRVVMPSNARDAAGLLRTAIRSGDPVIFLEPKHLYRQSHARRPYPGADYAIPFGQAATVRPGEDITVVAYGSLVEPCRRAAETVSKDGIECHVLDLRSLVPYDWERIRMSVERTGRLVVVHEEPRAFGFGAEIAARAASELFELLDAPIGRIGAETTWIGYSPGLERATLPQVEGIVELLRRTHRY